MTAIRPPRADEYDAIGEIFHEAVRQLAARDYTADQLRAWSGAPLPAGHWRKRTAALEVRATGWGHALPFTSLANPNHRGKT